MRHINIPLPFPLPARWSVIHCGRVAGLHFLTTQKQRSAYFRKYPSWNLLKKRLEEISAKKCWYCEAKSTRAPFDIDHFRPKLGITISRAKLAGHPGYYWLAYEWQNFRLSCQRCNRPEEDEGGTLCGKANEFPLQSEAARCGSATSSHAAEAPKLLDPCREADCALLLHAIDGEVKPAAAAATWEHQRARYTIDLLGFNSATVSEDKRQRWQTLAILIGIAGSIYNSDIVSELRKHLNHEHEYSSFFRSALMTHRDKVWIEDIL